MDLVWAAAGGEAAGNDFGATRDACRALPQFYTDSGHSSRAYSGFIGLWVLPGV